MTIRSFALVTLVMVMGSATGCTGMKNFLFGRGAMCGLCNRTPAAIPMNPYLPANPYAMAPAPAKPGCGLLPRCGLFNRNVAPAPPVACVPPMQYAPMATCPDVCQDPCANGGYAGGEYSVGMGGECGCAPTYGGTQYDGAVQYDGGVVDPYLGSGVTSGGYPVEGGYSQGDGFQPRGYQTQRFDPQGDRIISEDPLPPGVQYVN